MLKETGKQTPITCFSDPQEYTKRLCSVGGEYMTGSRAVGIKFHGGELGVIIDTSYYLDGGILPDQLMALAIHQEAELTSTLDDPHLDATIKEFAYIYEHFGESGLNQYHANLCNLIGGLNDTRNRALQAVLEK